jgi:hypothetical protein
MMRPTCCRGDQFVKVKAISSAPRPGDARNRPSPHGPVPSTSRANTGSSANTPPSTTANRSSEIAPRMILLRRI